MTIQTAAFATYGAIGNREDLADVIYDISPTETPFMSAVRRGKATAVLHEWQTDVLASASSTNAVLEGDVVVGTATTPTTRQQNYCQISRKDAVVTGTQESVDHAGRSSEMGYQMARRAKELKRDMEAIITGNQARVTGTTAVARKLRSLEAWLTSNVNRETTATSGGTKGKSATSSTGAATDATTLRTFTELQLKTVLKSLYNNGGEPTTLMLGPHSKTVFSSFTGRAQSQQIVGANVVNAGADIYKSDFGTIKVVVNRFMRARSAIAFDPEYAAVAYLRPFMKSDLAKNGDAERKFILAEYTLEVRNEKAFGIVADLKTTS